MTNGDRTHIAVGSGPTVGLYFAIVVSSLGSNMGSVVVVIDESDASRGC